MQKQTDIVRWFRNIYQINNSFWIFLTPLKQKLKILNYLYFDEFCDYENIINSCAVCIFPLPFASKSMCCQRDKYNNIIAVPYTINWQKMCTSLVIRPNRKLHKTRWRQEFNNYCTVQQSQDHFEWQREQFCFEKF